MPILEIKKLNVETERKKVLDDVSLKLEKGKIYALLGPNGSGKTSLSKAILGHPKLKIISGEILFNNKKINNLRTNERAKKGLFMAFQNPQEISGISVFNFLRKTYNSVHEKKLSILEFQKKINVILRELKFQTDFLERNLNENFSGGEKKKMEILQMLVLNPKFAILDETDSGLDIDSIRIISKGINEFMNKDKGILLITHNIKILDYIKPEKVFVMKSGEIVKEGKTELIKEIEKRGYGQF